MAWQDEIALMSAGDPVERWLRTAVACGAGLMIFGALSPWVDLVTFGGPRSQLGIEFFAGKLVLVLAVGLLAIAIFNVPLLMSFVVGGSAGVVELAWLIGNFAAFRQPPMPDLGMQPALGFGIAIFGTALATLSGFISVFPGARRDSGGR